MLVWLSIWSEVLIVCIWSGWCHCQPKPRHLLPDWNPDWFYLSGTSLPLNGCRIAANDKWTRETDAMCVCVVVTAEGEAAHRGTETDVTVTAGGRGPDIDDRANIDDETAAALHDANIIVIIIDADHTGDDVIDTRLLALRRPTTVRTSLCSASSPPLSTWHCPHLPLSAVAAERRRLISINISCLRRTLLQTRRMLLLSIDGTDRRADIRPFHIDLAPDTTRAHGINTALSLFSVVSSIPFSEQ